MISLHNIFSIAKYERKTLFRSWFFRIFSILSLLVLFGMNFGMVIEGGGDEGWAIRAIPSAIPYFNLLILNVAQAIIAVFLASDFLKRDKKLDTTEVIYMRSMTNGEYVIGKTLGNMQVFMILNIAVVIMALIFNSLAQGTAINWTAYGIYLLLISIPTLVFIMGLSFLLMSVIRNQAITFVLVLGYIGITLFLLQAKFYYIFDYMAFNIPMLSSDIVGFGNLETILIHRGMYFGLGAGFIFLTIFLLKRLPQSETMTWFSLIFAIVFIAGAGYLGFEHIYSFKQNEKLRAEIVELNNKYVGEAVPTILSNDLEVVHHENTIDVVSKMAILNDRKQPLNKLIFSLNAGLELSGIKLNGNDVRFLRDKQLIILSDNINLAVGDSAIIEFAYSGSIDETYCYLDIEEETRQEKYGKFVLNVDKRFAFITPEYVLLTKEANWYPKTGVTYSTKDVSWYHPQFVNYSLRVKTSEGLQAVSQGNINEITAGEYSFKNENPLTEVSLAIGHYKQKSIEKDSITFGLWYIDGHDYFSEQFPESKDTLASIISERFEDFKRTYNLDYSGTRFNIVEVPAQFKTYARMWTSVQEAVQPQQVLIPEKGYMMRDADFEKQKENVGRWGRGDNDMTDMDKEIRVMEGFIRKFIEEYEADRNFSRGNMEMTQKPNPYFIFPMLYNFQNNIQSDKWPITNRIFEAYLKGQAMDMRSIFMSNMNGESEDVLANVALQDETFEQILADPDQKDIVDNVIKLKGDVLFSMIQWKAGQKEFEDFLRQVLTENRYKNISFEDFDKMIYDRFGIELIPIMDDWFKAKALPGYLISPIKAVKVKSDDAMKTMVSLKVTNFSDVEGLVRLSFRMGGGGPGRGPGGGGDESIDHLIYLEAHQTKELSYLLDGSPRMVVLNTMTSKNIPQTMMQFFRDVEEDPKAKPVEGERIVETPVQFKLPNEIVVDNEDHEFSVTKNENVSLLEKLIVKEEEKASKYQGVNWWRPATSWTAVTNEDFYGEYVRSGYYIKGGEGDQVARWNVPIQSAGYYDVYFHLYKMRARGRDRNEEKGNYNFIIHGEDGPEQAALDIAGAETGWNHLGTYYFSPDTALIELTNKTQLRMVFADAVKLVEQ
ncbi:xanthan lyase [Maribellus sediminis]|uniref:golvesin C-terminal-like domain-containing protein n=1 Tax=Maribellus sediminis TaxID=2696285 RepID=UPI00143088DF|nr:xanthan lyase [Maribellus sediminis]